MLSFLFLVAVLFICAVVYYSMMAYERSLPDNFGGEDPWWEGNEKLKEDNEIERE